MIIELKIAPNWAMDQGNIINAAPGKVTPSEGQLGNNW